MRKSDSFKNVMTALGQFQAKAIKIRKDAINPHFKSKYASLAVILDEIQPTLTECGLVFTQIPENSEVLTTLLCHPESGEFIESDYKLNAVNVTPQGIGSAITYARRYALTAILGLNIDDDDDGNEANGNKAPEQKTQQTPPKQQQQSSQQQQSAPNGAINNGGITIQPQTPATPFNKQYSDAKTLLPIIETARENIEIDTLYAYNKKMIDGSPEIIEALKKQRVLIQNPGKKFITEGQFNKICGRLSKGETSVYNDTINAFILSHPQLECLKKALEELNVLEESLKIKYNNPADIAALLPKCNSVNQINRLHQNNAMIIDRDEDLMAKVNARIKEVK